MFNCLRQSHISIGDVGRLINKQALIVHSVGYFLPQAIYIRPQKVTMCYKIMRILQNTETKICG